MTKELLDIVSAGMLLVMIVIVLLFFVALLLKSRADRVQYIRSFKNGKVAVVYICAMPLFWLGCMCDGCPPDEVMWHNFHVIDSLFNAIQASVELVVLKYTIDPINDAMEISSLYRVVVYFCFTLAALNAIFFVFSIISQYMWHKFRSLRFGCSTKDKLFIFGNNPQNYSIYNSDSCREKVIIDKISKEELSDLYMQNFFYENSENLLAVVEDIVAKSIKGKNENIVVVNSDTDIRNIEICNLFNQTIAKLSPAQQELCFQRLKIFTFGDPQNESIYDDIVKNSHGCITYENPHQRIAIDIVENHPFALYLTEKEHLDYSTACVREGVDINALLVGFGKTNQQFFLTSVANNQFIAKENDEVVLKKVKYHLFDSDAIASSKRLNHTYNRYENEVLNKLGKGVSATDYLPLPSQPAETVFHNLNINATEFYNEVQSIVVANPLSANFVIVSFGSDLENIDMAKKLRCKFKEWGVPHYKIFVKVSQRCNEVALQSEPGCIAVGNEDEKVYNIDRIVTDRLTKMAQMRDEMHAIQYAITTNIEKGEELLTQEGADKISAAATKGWYFENSQLQRESSLYCCLSLRSKLNLIGLDYAPTSDERIGVTEKAYLERYATGDELKYYVDDKGATLKLPKYNQPIVEYPSEFIDSLRRNLAIHEHLRWNSFMISTGMIPATIDQILTELQPSGKHTNGKNYELRRHGNLTTFAGLGDFRDMVAKRDGVSPAKRDVVKYDYQLMDEAWWFLAENGYKIVEKR